MREIKVKSKKVKGERFTITGTLVHAFIVINSSFFLKNKQAWEREELKMKEYRVYVKVRLNQTRAPFSATCQADASLATAIIRISKDSGYTTTVQLRTSGALAKATA